MRLLILGCGYVGERLARAALARGMRVAAMTRSRRRAEALRALGVEAYAAASPLELPAEVLARAGAVLDSIPLAREAGSCLPPQRAWLPALRERLAGARWCGYLSSTAVYGDAGGDWVDEDSACRPASARGRARLAAEQAWLESGLPAEAFRLAGIYGPGRNLLARLLAGGYRAVRWEPPRWSNRIHVDDIVAALLAAMDAPRPGRVVNLADDAPLPHADYVRELARMVGAPMPELLTPEAAERELSPAALEFFRDSKRVRNARLHAELLPTLRYPDFRAGITPLLDE